MSKIFLKKHLNQTLDYRRMHVGDLIFTSSKTIYGPITRCLQRIHRGTNASKKQPIDHVMIVLDKYLVAHSSPHMSDFVKSLPAPKKLKKGIQFDFLPDLKFKKNSFLVLRNPNLSKNEKKRILDQAKYLFGLDFNNSISLKKIRHPLNKNALLYSYHCSEFVEKCYRSAGIQLTQFDDEELHRVLPAHQCGALISKWLNKTNSCIQIEKEKIDESTLEIEKEAAKFSIHLEYYHRAVMLESSNFFMAMGKEINNLIKLVGDPEKIEPLELDSLQNQETPTVYYENLYRRLSNGRTLPNKKLEFNSDDIFSDLQKKTQSSCTEKIEYILDEGYVALFKSTTYFLTRLYNFTLLLEQEQLEEAEKEQSWLAKNLKLIHGNSNQIGELEKLEITFDRLWRLQQKSRKNYMPALVVEKLILCAIKGSEEGPFSKQSLLKYSTNQILHSDNHKIYAVVMGKFCIKVIQVFEKIINLDDFCKSVNIEDIHVNLNVLKHEI